MDEETQKVKDDEGADGNPSALGFNIGPSDLEKQLQSERVEKGRLKKEAEKNAELLKENEALRAKVAELEVQKRDYLEMLPEDLRETLDENQARAIGVIAEGVSRRSARDSASAADREKQERLEEQTKVNERFARGQVQLNRLIERTHPGFMESVGEGGDKFEAWKNFIGGRMAPAIKAAYQNACLNDNPDDMLSFIDQFLSEVGSPNRGGTQPPRTPRTERGGQKVGAADAAKRYTTTQVNEEYESARKDWLNGKITKEEYAARKREIDRAYEEGRVDAD